MDIDKLNIHPQEIDKNTGRIILPNSNELDELKARTTKPEMLEKAAAVVSGIQAGGDVKLTEREDDGMDKKGGRAEKASDFSKPASDSSSFSQPELVKPMWVVSPMVVMCLCLIFLTLPLGIICALLLNENMQFKKQANQLTERISVIEKRDDRLLMSLLQQNTHLMKEVVFNKGPDFENGKANVYSGKPEQESSDLPLVKVSTEFVYEDENGNVIPEEEVMAGGYVLQEE